MFERSISKTLRQRVITLDGGACQICGFSLALNVHHVVPKEEGGLDALTNLVTVCPNHHAMAHAGLIAAHQFTTDPERRPGLMVERALCQLLDEVRRYAEFPSVLKDLELGVSARLAIACDRRKYMAACGVLFEWRRRRGKQ